MPLVRRLERELAVGIGVEGAGLDDRIDVEGAVDVRVFLAASLCCLEDIDGALVGGASLDPASFAQIVANSAT